MQTYFEKLQETLYSQGKGLVEEMNKICLFFIMCYEVCNSSNICTTVWDALPSLATPLYSIEQFLTMVKFVHTAYHNLVNKLSWVKHVCSPKKGVDAF